MKIFVSIFVFIIVLGIPETMSFSPDHSTISGELNLIRLDQIESFICKKAGTELKKNCEKSFTLNGHNVKTKIIKHSFGANIYEESFFEIQKPNNKFRMRLVIYPDGYQEFAVMIKNDEEFKNFHACFDSNGIMIEDDPWGKNKGNYTIEIFKLYEKYLEIYTQNVEAKSYLVER